MASFRELIDEVVEIVNDPDFLEAQAKRLLNRGLRKVCANVAVPLPELETSDTVVTVLDQNYLELPATYQRDLHFVYSTALNDEIKILPSYEHLASLYPSMDYEGSIQYVAIRGNRLYYQMIPGEVDTLRLQFFQLPTELSADADIPTVLPTHLHEDLLVNFAAKERFQRIEDGMDGQKVNTSFHEGRYLAALEELRLWVGPAKAEAG